MSAAVAGGSVRWSRLGASVLPLYRLRAEEGHSALWFKPLCAVTPLRRSAAGPPRGAGALKVVHFFIIWHSCALWMSYWGLSCIVMLDWLHGLLEGSSQIYECRVMEVLLCLF